MSKEPVPIRKWDDPALKQVCDSVADDESLDFVRDMKRTLGLSRNGVGLAAPQIGVLKRAIIVCPEKRMMRVMLNPSIVDRSEETETAKEGCLSYPGIYTPVERPVSVVARWQNTDREWFQESIAGWPARIIQHEIDHLDGICHVGDAAKAGATTGA